MTTAAAAEPDDRYVGSPRNISWGGVEMTLRALKNGGAEIRITSDHIAWPHDSDPRRLLLINPEKIR